MDRVALRLPIANDRDLLVDNIVGRQRMARDEQDEDVARTEPLLDSLSQSAPPGIRRSTKDRPRRA